MPYTLKIELHPLGVVVIDGQNRRELLIEGEGCCGVSFSELKQAAIVSGRLVIEGHPNVGTDEALAISPR